MLIELLKPRRNNTPVTMPDGNKVQFNEDARGRLVAEVANDQALLVLKHKDVFCRADVAPVAPPVAEEAADVAPTVRTIKSRFKKGSAE